MDSHPTGSDKISDEIYSAVINFLQKTYERISTDNIAGSVPVQFLQIITDVFDRYMKVAKNIVASPQHKFVVEHQITPVHKAHKIDTLSVKWLTNHPGFVNCTSNGRYTEKILAVRKQITYDTTENQFVKYVLNSTLKLLRRFKKRYLEFTDVPDENIISEANYMISSIKHIISGSYLHSVSDCKSIQGMSYVFGMPRRYRELYKYYLMIQRCVSISDDVFKILITDTADVIMSNNNGATVTKKLSLPANVDKKLCQVNWSKNDVLVGSFGSLEQFNINIAKRFYYVPARVFDVSRLPIHYIALYQSVNMFKNESGIKYYGEVLKASRVKRKDIPVKMKRNNGDEYYYAFRVREWKTLPVPITIKDEGVRGPRYTNMFLLEHCTQSYELFNIHSDAQYRLLYELKLTFNDVANNNSQIDSFYQIDNGKTLWVRKGYFDIMNENGEKLFDSPLKISDFTRHPGSYFRMIADRFKGC